MAIGGAVGLGTATGRLVIDTSQAQAAAATMRGVGQSINQSMGQTSTGVRRLGGAFRELRGEIAAVGLGAGVLSGLGLRTAASFEEVNIQLVGMTGSLAAANALTEKLRKDASRAGLPFADMLQMAKQLLPTLNGSTEELERWAGLVRRVAVLNPQEGIRGAAFSINEAISSGGTDLVSLAERFSISRVQLREAVEANGGDLAAALDQVLTKMGITQATADAMGNTFNSSLRRAKDAAVQLLAEGFQPLLDAMTPLLQGTAAWLSELRQTNPELVQLGAGLIAATAVAAPLALLLGQIATAASAIRLAGLGGALSTAGIVGLTAVGVGVGTVQGSRAIGRATDNDSLANMTLNQAMSQLTTMFNRAASALDRAFTNVAIALTDGAASIRMAFINAAEAIGNAINMLPGSMGAGLVQGAASARAATEAFAAERRRIEESGFAARELQRWRPSQVTEADRASAVPNTRAIVDAEEQMSQERLDTIRNWADAVNRIEQDAAQARIDATRQYEQQRADVIAQYELSIVREAEDFARQRLRQQQQLERSIADIREDAAEREADWWADLQDRINDLRSESTERLTDIEEQYNRNRERAERDHRSRIMEAASRLDARAIAEEQRRFRDQQRDQKEDYDQRVEDERENLQERIEQEQEAHEERLRDAREADEERIRDMRDAIAEQQRMEDEDRAIRLQRQAEDHRRQLTQMERAHQDRLTQITQQAAQERQRLDSEFVKQLAQLGIQNQRWLSLQKRGQDAALDLFEDFWDDFEKEINDRYNSILSNKGVSSGTTNPIKGTPNQPVPFARGGSVDYTGLAAVHGSRSRPEYMLSADTTATLRGMLGNFTQPQLLNAIGGAGRSMTMNMQAGAIQVYAAPGMSPGDVAMAVRNQMTEVIRELA